MALTFEKAKPHRSQFREWYQKNKERLSAKRKKLYAEDPEYRRRALEASNQVPQPAVFFLLITWG